MGMGIRWTRCTAVLLAGLVLVGLLPGGGCSDDDGAPADAGVDAELMDAEPDAEPDAGPDSGLVVGPLQELALLDSWDPSRPFNHSAEVTVAAHGGHVVTSAIHMHFHSAQTFDTTDFHKRVGVVVSHDAGETWGLAIDPNLGDQTTDPVVRVGADGTFWLAVWDTNSFEGAIGSSTDHGETWQIVVSAISFGDKEWIVVDDAEQAIWATAVSGVWKYDFAGTELAHSSVGLSGLAAYAHGGGVYFGAGWPDFYVFYWDGTGDPVQQGQMLPGGAIDQELNACMSLGRTADGGEWTVRAVRSAGVGEVVLRVRHLPADEGLDLRISDPAALAFFPAAVTDGDGRLHVIWYESGPGIGELRYTRSLSDDLIQGFEPPIVIDDAAVPTGGWYPYFSSAEGGRRLREYVDIAVDGNRAHLAWTHAPVAPSRVWATYVEFP